MAGNLFAYGSLQVPAVMRAVTGRQFAGLPAVLEGYSRCRLRRRCYPGVRRRDGACTEGILYRGVDRRALSLLDRFEDGFYRRRSLPVVVGPGRRLMAEVYVIPLRHHGLLEPRGWSLPRFRRLGLKSYVRQCRRWSASVGRSEQLERTADGIGSWRRGSVAAPADGRCRWKGR